MATDPFAALEQDHRMVERLLKTLADSDEGQEREALVAQLQQALTTHMQFEESEVYPLVDREIDHETAEEANVEHQLARDGLAKMQELTTAPGFGAAVEMVQGGIGHHVQDEEKEVFPQLRKRLDDDTKSRLADTLKQAKTQAGLPLIDVDGASKEQLLEAARESGADVNSRMTKDELKAVLAGR
jgi:hemerythrin superfamily protein